MVIITDYFKCNWCSRFFNQLHMGHLCDICWGFYNPFENDSNDYYKCIQWWNNIITNILQIKSIYNLKNNIIINIIKFI
jgi:hypothetical protein